MLQGLSYSMSYSSSIATLDNLSWFGLAFLALQGICHRLPPGSPIAAWVTDCRLGHRLPPGSPIAAWVTDCVQGDRLRPGRPIASRATDCVQGDRLRPGRPIASRATDCHPSSYRHKKKNQSSLTPLTDNPIMCDSV